MKQRKWLRITLVTLMGFGIFLLAGTAGFAWWGLNIPDPEPTALAALAEGSVVEVASEPWLSFRPQGSAPQVGFIFYPGARVAPEAYAPLAREIAAQGYLVVVPGMPLNFAVFNPNAADEIMAAFPEIRSWAVGGHSLGGAMAAAYAYNHPEQVQGLVLWASYPATNNNLSSSDLQVASIYGTLDGLTTPDKIDASRSLLPENTQWVAVDGGNHAGFGWYGEQAGDLPATLDKRSQQDLVVSATIDALNQLVNLSN